MNFKINPLTLEIVIHYWITVDQDYDPNRLDAPAVKEAIELLCEAGLLVEIKGKNNTKFKPNRYAMTPYIERLCSIPFPTKIWGYK